MSWARVVPPLADPPDERCRTRLANERVAADLFDRCAVGLVVARGAKARAGFHDAGAEITDAGGVEVSGDVGCIQVISENRDLEGCVLRVRARACNRAFATCCDHCERADKRQT